MPCKYTLEWLDTAVAVTLEHLRCSPPAPDDGQLAAVIDDAPQRAAEIQFSIKQQLFRLRKERQAELIIRQYHAALIALYDTLLEHSPAFAAAGGIPAEVSTCLSGVISGLLAFVEKRYHSYLSLEELVPPSYMHRVGAELKQRLDKLAPAIEKRMADGALAAAISEALTIQPTMAPLTFRELMYRKEILRQLEELCSRGKKACTSSAVNELLVYMNFNSKPYVAYFTHKMATRLDECQCDSEKVSLLLLAEKEFKQAYRREDAVLNSHDADLKTTIGNWFACELDFLERKVRLLALAGNSYLLGSTATTATSKAQKLQCSLSVDQIALLIRSADESRILLCRSMNAAFKTLVPFLSTEGRNDISPDSMRSKAYAAETRDKEIVIAKLKEMIEKIREY